jgi:MFS transporter, SP family, general alpha glucoside:H+ symporter
MSQPEKVTGDHVEGVVDNVGQLRGRAIAGQEHQRTYWQTLRRDPWLLFWIGVMLWTLIVRGFENQSSGAVISIPSFKKEFGFPDADGNYFVATTWQSALSGGSNGAAIIGAFLASYTADIFGIKPVTLAFAALNLVSVGIEFATTSIGMFLAGKLLNFVAIGAFLNLCTTYVADVSPLAIRASCIGFCNLSQCIGPFISAIMSNFTQGWTSAWAWKSIICAQWGFCGISFILLWWLPESPVYLVRKNKLDAAKKSLARLYSDATDAEGHFQQISLTLEEAEAQRRASYVECFRGTNLRRTLIAILVWLSEPMAGLGFVSNYGALMYQFLDISNAESFRIQIGAQILSISGALLAMLIGDFYGRRPMFLAGCAGLVALLFAMGISGSINTTAAVTASVGFYTMFNFCFNIGVGSIVYTISGEIPTSVLRQKTLAIAISVSAAVNTFWSFVSPYIFNPDYGNLKAKIGFVFGACMIIFFVLGFLYVPETRLRTYEELDELFAEHVPARKFKGHVTVAEQRADEAFEVITAKGGDLV